MVGDNFVDLFYLVNSLAYLKFTLKGNKLVYLKNIFGPLNNQNPFFVPQIQSKSYLTMPSV